MEQTLSLIEDKKQKLGKTQFCQWLGSNHQLGEDRLSFTPSMAFFVLGFRDIISALNIENPTTDIERQINTHCKEDLDHWKWYLHDLEMLGFNFQSWGSSVTDIFKNIWSNSNAATRELVYTTIHHIKKSSEPALRLVTIEVLEAAFGVFINCMNTVTHRENVYKELDYFGKTHVEKEESHSLGNWLDPHEIPFQTSSIVLSPECRQEAQLIIDKSFALFEQVFASWYEARHTYRREVKSKRENPAVTFTPPVDPSLQLLS